MQTKAEYKNGRKTGAQVPNSMWEKMPTVMLAKCAEAQAHRRVCSLNAGMYEPAELDHLDSEPVRVQSQRADNPGKGKAAARAALGIAPEPQPEPAPEAEAEAEPAAPAEETHPDGDPAATPEQIDSLIRELDAANITTGERAAYVRGVIGRDVGGWQDLTAREAADIVEFTTTGELPIRD